MEDGVPRKTIDSDDDDKELVIAEDHTADPTTSAEPTDGMFWLFNVVSNTVINFFRFFDSNRIPKCWPNSEQILWK